MSPVGSMTLSERLLGDVTIVEISGRITVQDGVQRFRDSMQGLFLRGRTSVVIDLLNVPYIDSTALGELVRTYTTAKRMGGAVKLLRAAGRVRELLALTGLWPVFDAFQTEDDAIRSFGIHDPQCHPRAPVG
jgi:anti-sigma B factor antagonist